MESNIRELRDKNSENDEFLIGNPDNFNEPEFNNKKSNKKRIIIILSAILLVVTIVLTLYFLLRSKEEERDDEEEEEEEEEVEDKDCDIGKNEKCLSCKKEECAKCNPFFRLENGKCFFIYSFVAIYNTSLKNKDQNLIKLFNIESLTDYKINKIQVDGEYVENFESNSNYYNFTNEGVHEVKINIDLKIVLLLVNSFII